METPTPAAPVKSGKMGCGAIMAIILVCVILLAIGSNQGIKYYFTHCPDGEIFDCFLNKVEDKAPEGAVTATGEYTYKGYSVTITANIPLEGGAVTGTVSGTCDGAVKGSFSGQNNGAISGTMTGVCSPFFINVPAAAKFNGTVNKDSKTVPFSFTGQGAGISHSGSTSLAY